jgi:hypothetical protein
MSHALYERFRQSFLGDVHAALRDGLDTEALLALEGDQRTRAEAELLPRLDDDDRAVVALGLLRSAAAAPYLRERFEVLRAQDAPGDRELVLVALALWQIERHDEAPTALADALARGRFPVDRSFAAAKLATVDAPAVEAPLVAAMDDDDNVVRQTAARSLLIRKGLLAPRDPSPPMVRDVMSGDPARRSAGVAAVRQAVGA